MYTKSQIKAIRNNEIAHLAELGNVGIKTATSLYNRLVRFSLRWYRWATIDCSENLTGRALESHEHEGNLLKGMAHELGNELEDYGLEMTFPGLYPWIGGARTIELVWY
jgi:hypothetical protein